MITYLILSSLSLLILTGFYTLVLENQPVHRIKRVYLLCTLLVSFLGPMITIDVISDVIPISDVQQQLSYYQIDNVTSLVNPLEEPADNPVNYWLWLYGAVTVIMLFRFARNLYQLAVRITRTKTQLIYSATLVLLPENVIPHTFLHYLFVSKTAYECGEIEGELFTHELTHIRQRHSLDILLMELLLCVGWFSPVLFWLKKAIQLNHEFLADEAVNNSFQNVPNYQYLLLSSLTRAIPLPALVSTLTFQTIKKRLLMMTKHASPVRTWLTGIGTALLFGATAALLATKSPAQVAPAPTKANQTQPATAVKNAKMDVTEMERRFGDKKVHVILRRGEKIVKHTEITFSELTAEQKAQVEIYSPNPPKLISVAQFESYKNPKKYGVWVDEKRTRSFPNTTLKASDIVYYSYSYVYENARQPEGYLYQVELKTKAGYEKYLRHADENPTLVLDSRPRRKL